jgi:hypothetical protein
LVEVMLSGEAPGSLMVTSVGGSVWVRDAKYGTGDEGTREAIVRVIMMILG